MFKDIIISEHTHSQYNQGDPRKRKKQLFETEYFILTQGSWPINANKMDLRIPKEITDTHVNFENFYKEKFQKRSLTWNIEYCSSLIKGTFGAENY
jgi:hypothetical protein